MKKRVFCLFLCLILVCCQAEIIALADNRNAIVYYAVGSKSAYRYHARSDCPGLSRSTVGEITLEEAVLRGLSPCSRCHPPAADFEIEVTPKPVPEQSVSSTSRSYTSDNRDNLTRELPEHSEYSLSPVLTAPPTASSLQSPTNSRKRRSLSFSDIMTIIPICSIPVLGLFLWIVGKVEDFKSKKKKELEHQQWLVDKKKYEDQYLGKSTLDLCGAPPDCYVDKDGYPCSKNKPELWWGDGYSFLTLSNGKGVIHRPECRVCRSKRLNLVDYNPAHYFGYKKHPFYIKPYSLHPCGYCSPVMPDLSWYREYLRIKAIRDKYEIPEP